MADRYFDEFEAKGEGVVRKELALGVYGEPRAKHARHWLSEKDRLSMRRDARDAKIAAWVASIAAVVAAMAAII